MFDTVGAFNQRLQAGGWVFAGGLQATTTRPRPSTTPAPIVVTDGPFVSPRSTSVASG